MELGPEDPEGTKFSKTKYEQNTIQGPSPGSLDHRSSQTHGCENARAAPKFPKGTKICSLNARGDVKNHFKKGFCENTFQEKRE